MKHAFTLIELLIVVAIIAILAAIAVPNFLEAQVRAKVSRVKSDMRALATAVETYHIDCNKYPAYSNPLDEAYPGYNNHTGPSASRFELKVPVRLTTPIAYMSTLFNDTFPNAASDAGDSSTPHPFHYCTDDDGFTADPTGTPGLDQYPVKALFTMVDRSSDNEIMYSNTSMQWLLLSHGPDNDHDSPDEGLSPRSYDPTNGTVSSGDLYFFGPGPGLK